MNDIVVYQSKGGDWIAKRKSGDRDAQRGKGPSSVEAHLDLLEREEAAGALRQEGTTAWTP